MPRIRPQQAHLGTLTKLLTTDPSAQDALRAYPGTADGTILEMTFYLLALCR